MILLLLLYIFSLLFIYYNSPVEKAEKVVKEVKLSVEKKPPNLNLLEQVFNFQLEEFIEY